MEELTQIQGEVDFVVLCAGGERRALPPPLGSIDRMDGWVRLPGILRIAVVTELALDGVAAALCSGAAHQFAEKLRSGP